ncbi:MAG: hypothetical protein LUQ65_05895 [Candidatus Helarchaeota archaeon]|nr:hypothetical protein [Candidatus Helarchaeota archaeon]
MGTDELDDDLDDLEFEKKMDELESGIEIEKKKEKSEIMAVKLNKEILIDVLGILYVTMIIVEWIFLYLMTLMVSPLYIMSAQGYLHIAGAIFLIPGFGLNIYFQFFKNSSESGKMSIFFGLVGATIILISAFQNLQSASMVILITFTLMILGLLQYYQIVYRKSPSK